MVRASVESASSSVASAFEDRDLKTIATTGGLAALGFVLAVTAGTTLSDVLGFGETNMSRAKFAVVAIGAAVAAMVGLSVFGPAVGGAFSVGALVAIGVSLILVVLGGGGSSPVSGGNGGGTEGSMGGDYFRAAIDGADASGAVPSLTASATGCSTCGSSPRPVQTATTPRNPYR